MAAMLKLRALVVSVAVIGCNRSVSTPAAGSGSARPLDAAAADAAPADAAPALPDGLRALAPNAPLPALAVDDVLLLSDKPGAAITLTGAGGKTLAIPEGAIARRTESYDLVGGWKATDTDRAEIQIEETHQPPHAAQLVTRAEDVGHDFPHHQVWFVPTVATRTQLAEDASEIIAEWSDPQRRWAVVMLDHTASLVDVKTGAVTPIGERVGSPSFAADGTLYYRTLDGGAYRWTGARGEKIGKGKRGKPQTGDLNDGIEPAEYPPPVTFSAAGVPSFK